MLRGRGLSILIFGLVLYRLFFTCDECFSKNDYFFIRKYEVPWLKKVRENSYDNIGQYMPTPYKELLFGLILGKKDATKIKWINDVLIRTGTVHVIVVSGYNISLISLFLLKIFRGIFHKWVYFLIPALSGLFVLLVGGDPPVLRAWLMGTIVMFSQYSGRSVASLKVLVFSGLAMLLINPLYIRSLSFQLSFLATLGLILYSKPYLKLLNYNGKSKPWKFIIEDLSTTLAAQTLVVPLLSYRFGEASLISPLANALLLWTIPLATIGGIIFLIVSYVSAFLAGYMAFMVSIPIKIFLLGVEFFSKFKFSSIDYQISLSFLLAYYVFLFFIWLTIQRRL